VVLSNNDGCVIAANKEAKAISEIPMFEPVFKIKKQLIRNRVTFFLQTTHSMEKCHSE